MGHVEQRSPRTQPPGVLREVGERAVNTHPAARSLHLTDPPRSWIDWCADYRPGPWNPSDREIGYHLSALESVLAAALARMRARVWFGPVPEETSAGSCYDRSAA